MAAFPFCKLSVETFHLHMLLIAEETGVFLTRGVHLLCDVLLQGQGSRMRGANSRQRRQPVQIVAFQNYQTLTVLLFNSLQASALSTTSKKKKQTKTKQNKNCLPLPQGDQSHGLFPRAAPRCVPWIKAHGAGRWPAGLDGSKNKIRQAGHCSCTRIPQGRTGPFLPLLLRVCISRFHFQCLGILGVGKED